ncbi:DUF2089 domain-containing protein [Clostridium estertheticum]|uniref:DUF2089 domain-containing protein n=1 Tax=Clostridium estertheticum TaxID=238834 RepID=UPI001C0D968D|nr:DUF2089 domain-containing protein [Clostridium estertheticum]MBU3074870.1 DUF2089 domain-containing protein [Clostridium estertheticum]MBU3165085.1 DUF2089 domain-containing protein [Clostridium estertheticum]
MAYKIITQCPVCSSKLTVTKLKCKKCDTVIENEFELSKFSYLTMEQLSFVEVFIKCRGNIKDVEKELGISYPTVRGKLEDLIASLGYTQIKEKEDNSADVIDRLEKGEITAEQALNLLKNSI